MQANAGFDLANPVRQQAASYNDQQPVESRAQRINAFQGANRTAFAVRSIFLPTSSLSAEGGTWALAASLRSVRPLEGNSYRGRMERSENVLCRVGQRGARAGRCDR